VSDVHDLVDLTRAFLGKRLPRGPNIAIITTSGGSAVLMADACDRYGLKLPCLAPQTVTAVEQHAPKHCSLANPIDLTAQISGRNASFNAIVDLILNDPNVDQLIVRYGTVQGASGEAWARELSEIVARSDKPLFVSLGRVPDTAGAALRVLEENRVPWILTPLRTAVAAGGLHQYAEKRRRFLQNATREPVRPLPRQEMDLNSAGARLSERESKRLLAAYGVPIAREVAIAVDAIAALDTLPLDFPVVAKVDSRDIPHKTEANAVRIGIPDLASLKKAAAEIVANARAYKPGAQIDGVLVAEMAAGTEVIVGVVNDPYFGPFVMFGLGGVFTELLKDVTYRFAPFDAATAREMIGEIKSAPLLTGYRGQPALAVEALADAISRISWLAADHAERIAEIDVNPLFVDRKRAVAADALIVLKSN
jgi:acyl-CoA synthetase (NDP forming)